MNANKRDIAMTDTNTTKKQALGRLAARAAHRAGHRPGHGFDQLLTQTRRSLEHQLAQVDEELAVAKIERDAADLRYRTLEASAGERKNELRRRLAAL